MLAEAYPDSFLAVGMEYSSSDYSTNNNEGDDKQTKNTNSQMLHTSFAPTSSTSIDPKNAFHGYYQHPEFTAQQYDYFFDKSRAFPTDQNRNFMGFQQPLMSQFRDISAYEQMKNESIDPFDSYIPEPGFANAAIFRGQFSNDFAAGHSSIDSNLIPLRRNSSISTSTDNENSPTSPRKRKGTKRRVSKDASACEAAIAWEDLCLDESTAQIVFSVVPKEKINQFLSDGASPLICGLGAHLNADQQNALKTVKQRLRAEKKSRREKQRRVHVNNSLTVLASKINIKPEEQDMNSILVNAVKFIEDQQKEIENLRNLLERKD